MTNTNHTLAADPTDQAVPQALTMQELFDRAVVGVIEQGEKSCNPRHGTCEYRSQSGLKCTVGHLISDEVYATYAYGGYLDAFNYLEGKTLSEDIVRRALITSVGLVDQRSIAMLGLLQEAHDDFAAPDVDGWFNRFCTSAKDVALVYALNLTALNEARSRSAVGA